MECPAWSPVGGAPRPGRGAEHSHRPRLGHCPPVRQRGGCVTACGELQDQAPWPLVSVCESEKWGDSGWAGRGEVRFLGRDSGLALVRAGPQGLLQS